MATWDSIMEKKAAIGMIGAVKRKTLDMEMTRVTGLLIATDIGIGVRISMARIDTRKATVLAGGSSARTGRRQQYLRKHPKHGKNGLLSSFRPRLHG